MHSLFMVYVTLPNNFSNHHIFKIEPMAHKTYSQVIIQFMPCIETKNSHNPRTHILSFFLQELHSKNTTMVINQCKMDT